MKRTVFFLGVLIFMLTGCALDSIQNSSTKEEGKIEMPYDSEKYCGSEWTIESLTEHLKDLGFTNIKTEPCEPSDDDYNQNIFEICIKTGLFSTGPWKKGEKYEPDALISVYYNESPTLTIKNCPDLKNVLITKKKDYMKFAKKYDGRYIKFNGYIHSHSTYDGGTSHIIDVAYGNKLEDEPTGELIRIGDRTKSSVIDDTVEEGDLVAVSGRIDASWCKFYKQLYIECMQLELRDK